MFAAAFNRAKAAVSQKRPDLTAAASQKQKQDALEKIYTFEEKFSNKSNLKNLEHVVRPFVKFFYSKINVADGDKVRTNDVTKEHQISVYEQSCSFLLDNRLILVDKSKESEEYETEINNYLSCKNADFEIGDNDDVIIERIVSCLTPKIEKFHTMRIEYVRNRINNLDRQITLGEISDLVHCLTDGYEHILKIKEGIWGGRIWYITDIKKPENTYTINEKDEERTFKKLSSSEPTASKQSEKDLDSGLSIEGGKRRRTRRGRRGARRHTNKRKQKKTKRYRNRSKPRWT